MRVCKCHQFAYCFFFSPFVNSTTNANILRCTFSFFSLPLTCYSPPLSFPSPAAKGNVCDWYHQHANGLPFLSLCYLPPNPTASLSGAASEEVIWLWLARHALITMNITMLSVLSVSFEARQAAESDAFFLCLTSVLAPSKIRCWGGRSKGFFFFPCAPSLSLFAPRICGV